MPFVLHKLAYMPFLFSVGQASKRPWLAALDLTSFGDPRFCYERAMELKELSYPTARTSEVAPVC